MSQDDASIRQENMRLRAELSALEARRVEAARKADALAATNARLEAEWDALLNSSIWRMAQRLFRLAEHVPPQLRRGVRLGVAGARGLGRRTVAGAPSAVGPRDSPPASEPAIPGNALYFGLFTQDAAELAANPWYDPLAPLVTIIILNWNRSEMTLACVRYVLRHTRTHRFEIIIADNGSTPAELAILHASGLPGQVLAMGRNLYFGEANNIAAEQARGEYLFFLNNDAFVHDGWLDPLIDAIERLPRVGAVGSRLLYPDGTLQEAGGLVSADGMANQLGKHASGDDERYVSLRQVDYASAAALLIRRQDFLDVLGFDLCYEPAYYEDTDLCMKLRARGQAIFYAPDSVVTHVENATSLDKRHDLRLENIIQANRITFASRWGDFLLGLPPKPSMAPPPYHPNPGATGRPRVALHTPFFLTPGGGERYLLSIGQALAAVADVTLVTATPCSAIRLRRIGLDLQLDVSAIALQTLGEATAGFDLAFVMGNSVLPPVAGLGRHNFYVCQFPFPMRDPDARQWTPNWQGYDQILVYSGFVRRHLATRIAALDLPAKPVTTIAPPVRLLRGAAVKRQMILSVGRFFAGHHCKRQDLMVAALRTLVADGVDCELHLAGSLRPEPEHRAYYLSVAAAAQGLPVFIHPNIDAAGLDRLYADASVYWHLTGYGSDLAGEPELSEHFGIALVEAMSAGCVPVAFDAGGPADIIASGEDGFLVGDLDEFVERTRTLLADPALTASLGQRAAATASRYDEAVFERAVGDLAASFLPLPVP